MKIRVMVFKAENPNSQIRSELAIEEPVDLENIRQQTLPTAYLVRDDDLKEIRKFDKLVNDRGVKHKAKGLSKLLLGHKRFPLIKGNFESPRQLGRSIRTLLANASRKQDRNAYFIGITEPIFEGLWATSKNDTFTDGSVVQGNFRGSHPIEQFPQVSSWLVNELAHRCHVPQDLADRYIGASHDTMLVRQMIVLAAQSENEVLIIGDTGTGKEVVAREIHSRSHRKGRNLLAINCSGIPTALFESELFGYEKGAFTNALDKKEGLWKKATDGTLFLDEIGDLPPESQVKILRALEEGEIHPLGSDGHIKVNARVIAATNRDLFGMVQKGDFREDLYYRLRGFLIRTPALRYHVEDVPVLADFLWKKITKDLYKPLPQEIVELLKLYRWPGNVRELKKVLEYLYSLFGPVNLRSDHLKAVFLLEGQEVSGQVSKTQKKRLVGKGKKDIQEVAAGLHHVKHSQEVIRSLELQFEKMKTNNDKSLDIAFKFGMYDLESLCRRPSLFGDAFPAVWGLLEGLNRYQEPFQAETTEAKRLESRLSEAFTKVQASLSNETKVLIESVL